MSIDRLASLFLLFIKLKNFNIISINYQYNIILYYLVDFYQKKLKSNSS